MEVTANALQMFRGLHCIALLLQFFYSINRFLNSPCFLTEK